MSIAEKAAAMTPEKRIQTAARILRDGEQKGMTQQNLAYYLMDYEAGPMISQADYLAALNIASDGELLKAAGLA